MRGIAAVREALLRRTDPRRRFNCRDQSHESWNIRAVVATEMLARHLRAAPPEGTSRLRIGDFGAGNERVRQDLERSLDAPFDYFGYDLYPQSRRVERIDLARELPTRSFDAVFCLGLLEYLKDVEEFAGRLPNVCRLAIVSYVIADGAGALPQHERRARGWINDYTRAGMEDLFESSGLAVADAEVIDDGLSVVWLFEAASP